MTSRPNGPDRCRGIGRVPSSQAEPSRRIRLLWSSTPPGASDRGVPVALRFADPAVGGQSHGRIGRSNALLDRCAAEATRVARPKQANRLVRAVTPTWGKSALRPHP
jgi:hypothetical protein